MKNTKTVFCLLLISAIAIIGCSNDDDSKNYLAPTFANDTIRIPDTLIEKIRTNPNLSHLSAISSINRERISCQDAFVFYKSEIDNWESTENSDGSRTYINPETYFKITYFHTSGKSWWKYETPDSLPHSFAFSYAEMIGTSGKIESYTWDDTLALPVLLSKVTWTKKSNTLSETYNYYHQDSIGGPNKLFGQYVISSNSDKSGTIKSYMSMIQFGEYVLVLLWEDKWDSAGNGTHTKYEIDGTTVQSKVTF